jgi:hypothetical protein
MAALIVLGREPDGHRRLRVRRVHRRPTPRRSKPAVRAARLRRRGAAPLEARDAVAPGRRQLHRQRRARFLRAGLRARARPSACAMAFRVADAAAAFKRAVARRRPVTGRVGPMELNIPAIEGIGGSLIYLVDRYGAGGRSTTSISARCRAPARPKPGAGLTVIDHLTHNVHRGRMDAVGAASTNALQLPRDPLLRHRGQAHRPEVRRP